MAVQKMTVANYLTQQLAICGRSQRDIATAVGYTSPNMITMMKQGKTKLPYSIVGRLAKAIDADPAYLLRLAMQEYDPGLWQTVEGILATETIMTSEEWALLKLVRDSNAGCPIYIESLQARRVLTAAIESVVASSQRKAHASVAAINRLPRNARHVR